MKKIIAFTAAFLLLFALSACDGGKTTSSEAASSEVTSSGTTSEVELTKEEQTALEDYISAVSVRSSYLSGVYTRSFDDGEKVIDTVMTFFQPQGPGYFTFKKTAKIGDETVLTEQFTKSGYVREYMGSTETISFDAFTAVIKKVESDSVTHTRVPFTSDFDYKNLTVTDVEILQSEIPDTEKMKITFENITEGRLLDELGFENATAKAVVTAVIDEEETMISEETELTVTENGTVHIYRLTMAVSSPNAVESL